MLTDSENNMMNKFFSLHSIGGGRFFLLLLLWGSLQMIQAAGRHSEIPSSPLLISEGAIVSGKEQIYVSHHKKEKAKVSKSKKTPISGKRKGKKAHTLSQNVETTHTTTPIFIQNTTSGQSLLTASDNDRLSIRPNQNTSIFLLPRSENEETILINLPDILLKKNYKSHQLSSLRFFRNFKRPPPSLIHDSPFI